MSFNNVCDVCGRSAPKNWLTPPSVSLHEGKQLLVRIAEGVVARNSRFALRVQTTGLARYMGTSSARGFCEASSAGALIGNGRVSQVANGDFPSTNLEMNTTKQSRKPLCA